MKYKTGHRLFLVFALIANGSLAMFAHCADVFGYNERNEVGLSRRDAEGAENEFEYNYDDIGNRIALFDLGTNRTCTANDLNQCLEISTHADGTL